MIFGNRLVFINLTYTYIRSIRGDVPYIVKLSINCREQILRLTDSTVNVYYEVIEEG